MAIVFPSSPTVGQVFTSGGRSWVWTGSTWDSPSSVTAALSGLTLVKSQAIGTAVTSVEVTEAFSANYNHYEIIVSGGVTSTASTGMKIQFGATTANYRYGLIYQNLGSNAVVGYSAAGSSIEYIGGANSNQLSLHMKVANPFLTRNTSTQSMFVNGSEGGVNTGVLLDNNSYTSFKLSTIAAGNWTGGTVSVYGYRKE
jgi:hypothetical protein